MQKEVVVTSVCEPSNTMKKQGEDSNSNEIVNIDDDIACYMGIPNGAGGGANDASLCEYDDYDGYDGDEYDFNDLTEEQLAFCDAWIFVSVVRLNGVVTFVVIVGLVVTLFVLVVLVARFFNGHSRNPDKIVQFVRGKTKFGDAVDGAIKIFTVVILHRILYLAVTSYCENLD
ncbi:hypothetical protein Tco_1230984 [Tanacetum coccineum]